MKTLLIKICDKRILISIVSLVLIFALNDTLATLAILSMNVAIGLFLGLAFELYKIKVTITKLDSYHIVGWAIIIIVGINEIINDSFSGSINNESFSDECDDLPRGRL